MLSEADFAAYRGKGYNRVPLARELLADLETPLSVYLKLGAARYSYLLESIQGGETWGRYSLIGLPCREVLRVRDHAIEIERDGVIVERHERDNPLDFVRDFRARFRVPPGNRHRFAGGLVGYFGYDTVRYFEPSLGPCQKPDAIGAPDILLLVSDALVVFDNRTGRLEVVVYADPEDPQAYGEALDRLDEIAATLHLPLVFPPANEGQGVPESAFTSECPEPRFMAAVEQAREYIRAGDVMQVVLSQRLSTPYHGRVVDLYRALRVLNPSPYMYLFDFGEFQVVGSSPEILARLEDDRVAVRPIAGTRRRGETEAEDERLEKELLADAKERAEHLMLIDLGRNDVGRVSETGSVHVTETMTVERYSHVMHIVSHVHGHLRAGLDAIDVLEATHPAGTLSGAPKVRAMEIIDELEVGKRGIYGGAVGYLAWNGNMDCAIAIRTAVIHDGRLYLQVGAGIVADSDPKTEWEETLSKARALARAVDLADRGLIGMPGDRRR